MRFFWVMLWMDEEFGPLGVLKQVKGSCLGTGLLGYWQNLWINGKEGHLWHHHTVLDYFMVEQVFLESLCSLPLREFTMMLSMKKLALKYHKTCHNVVSSLALSNQRFIFLSFLNYYFPARVCSVDMRLVIMYMTFLQLEMILPDRAYAFFSHTHKAQKENMPLLDKVVQLFSFSLLFSSF